MTLSLLLLMCLTYTPYVLRMGINQPPTAMLKTQLESRKFDVWECNLAISSRSIESFHQVRIVRFIMHAVYLYSILRSKALVLSRLSLVFVILCRQLDRIDNLTCILDGFLVA